MHETKLFFLLSIDNSPTTPVYITMSFTIRGKFCDPKAVAGYLSSITPSYVGPLDSLGYELLNITLYPELIGKLQFYLLYE